MRIQRPVYAASTCPLLCRFFLTYRKIISEGGVQGSALFNSVSAEMGELDYIELTSIGVSRTSCA